MLSYQEMSLFLQFISAELREIVFEVRNLVAELAPTATEEIRPGGINYYFKDRGGHVSAGVCGMTLKPDHVRLFFPHGAFIADPKGLLQGNGIAMRFVQLSHYDSTPWEDLKALIAAHAQFDPRTINP